MNDKIVLARPRGRPLGSRNKHGTPKINVHYRIDPRIDAALKTPGPVSKTLEAWGRLAGVVLEDASGD